jgi:hypothetical protein
MALKHASDELKGDREIVLTAVRRDLWAFEYAALNDLNRDGEIIMAAIEQPGMALQYANDGIRGNREFILAAISRNPLSLEYASDDIKRDRQIVLAAVRKNGSPPHSSRPAGDKSHDKVDTYCECEENYFSTGFKCMPCPKDEFLSSTSPVNSQTQCVKVDVYTEPPAKFYTEVEGPVHGAKDSRYRFQYSRENRVVVFLFVEIDIAVTDTLSIFDGNSTSSNVVCSGCTAGWLGSQNVDGTVMRNYLTLSSNHGISPWRSLKLREPWSFYPSYGHISLKYLVHQRICIRH